MRPEDIRAGLLSRDPAAALGAAHALRAADRPTVAALAPEAERFVDATAGLDLGGALVANRVHMAEALSRLRLLAADPDACLCRAIPRETMSGPGQGAYADLVETTATRQGDWEVHLEARCRHCARMFHIVENHGWHVPVWTWKDADAPD